MYCDQKTTLAINLERNVVASDRRDEGGRMDGCFNINSFKIHVSSVFVQFN